MSDWADGFGGDWTGGFDLPGGGDLGGLPEWVNGFDLPGGDPGAAPWVSGGDLPGGGDGKTDWGGLGGSTLNSIIKAITGGGGGSGSSTGLLGQLLPLLLAGGGGLLNYNRTNKGADEMIAAANKANETVTGLLGGHSKNYDAYTAAGNKAIAAMSGAAPSNLAGQFQSNMASQFKPLQGMTLANYARGR